MGNALKRGEALAECLAKIMMRILPVLLRRFQFIILLPAIFCLSCSGVKFNPVQGKVLYKNEPIGGVSVVFHPSGSHKGEDVPHGVTEEDGSFTLRTGVGSGAPAGDYVVTFSCPEEKDKKAKLKGFKMEREFQDRFKGAYSEPAKSNFKVSIKSGSNDLEPFNLK
jgi:hypothetical protein